jgi:SAM-dependent methyltransferase
MPKPVTQSFRGEQSAQDAVAQIDYLDAATAQDTIYAGRLARAQFLSRVRAARVLDVGCGLGDSAVLIAGHLDGGEVVGVDQSEPLLAEARARAAAAGASVEFVPGDAAALPFDDASFSAAVTERTLQHVASPAEVIAEMARVVRPGGVVLAVEPDWATLVLDSGDADVADAVVDAVRAQVRHGEVGRSLRRLMVDADLVDVVVSVESHATDSLMVARHLGLLDEGLVAVREQATFPADRLDRWVSDLEHDQEVGTFTASLSLFVAWGTVPGR